MQLDDIIFFILEWDLEVVVGSIQLSSLQNLFTGVTYSIRVSASNSMGEGPYSDIFMVKTVQGGEVLLKLPTCLVLLRCECDLYIS